MGIQRATYVLICLTMWAEFDNVLLADRPILTPAPLVDDDDEYPAVKREQGPVQSLSTPRLVGLKPKTDNFVSICPRKDASPGVSLAAIGSSPLYVLMSLQL
jgi:hypothetical protein